MHANNPESIYFAGSGNWTQDRLITVSGCSAHCANEPHRQTLSHSCNLLKPFDGFRCPLEGTLVGSNGTLCYVESLAPRGGGDLGSNPRSNMQLQIVSGSVLLPLGEYKRGTGWTCHSDSAFCQITLVNVFVLKIAHVKRSALTSKSLRCVSGPTLVRVTSAWRQHVTWQPVAGCSTIPAVLGLSMVRQQITKF